MARFKSSPLLLAVAGLVVLLGSKAFGQGCTGSSPTWTSTPDQASVSQCITNASNGDTINVTAGTGSVTWSGTVAVNKDLSIIGPGASNLTINSSSGADSCFNLSLGNTTRLSGFAFNGCVPTASSGVVAGKTFRFDHNSFTMPGFTELDIISGPATSCNVTPETAIQATGLIDNNTFNNVRVDTVGTQCALTDGNYQHALWAQPPPKGSLGTGIVYVEDNTFNANSIMQNDIDSNYAGRYVFRFNTVNGINGNTGGPEIHSVQGMNRAVQWWEIYKNYFNKTGSSSWFSSAFIRGGSGLDWGNWISDLYTNDIMLSNVRSEGDPSDPPGSCNGSSNWDGNSGTVAGSGYPCRDQLGRSYDTTQWAPGQAYNQPLTPAYFWNNLKGLSNSPITIAWDTACGSPSCPFNPVHTTIDMVANRDFYNQVSSYNGTSGVGVGTLAQRPATCTTGVGYWATDQGNWNHCSGATCSAGAGIGATEQGVLYRCSSTNTWTVYYTPYTYPHPLQSSSGGGSGSPTAPSGLQAIVN